MRSFEVVDGTPQEFVERVRRELADRGLSRYVEVVEDGADLVVKFRYMGSTRLRYRMEPGSGGFRAVLSGESVSPLHATFRQRFDEQLEQVLGVVGARLL